MERILIVEDDPAAQRTLVRLFEAAGYSVEVRGDGESAIEALREAVPTAIVLDLRLPAMPGKEVCREIKRQNSTLPIVILSAISDASEIVLLLELGADDYVTKPFSPKELLARVRAAIRRAHKANILDSFSFDEVSVDFARMEVTRDSHPIVLTAQQFKLLKFFVQNPERVISRDELLHTLGYPDHYPTRILDNYLSNLEPKLERDPANPVHFRTVHGTGYKFLL